MPPRVRSRGGVRTHHARPIHPLTYPPTHTYIHTHSNEEHAGPLDPAGPSDPDHPQGPPSMPTGHMADGPDRGGRGRDGSSRMVRGGLVGQLDSARHRPVLGYRRRAWWGRWECAPLGWWGGLASAHCSLMAPRTCRWLPTCAFLGPPALPAPTAAPHGLTHDPHTYTSTRTAHGPALLDGAAQGAHRPGLQPARVLRLQPG